MKTADKAHAIVLSLTLSIGLGACSSTPTLASQVTARPTGTPSSQSAAPSPISGLSVSCLPDPAVTSGSLSNPCPSALDAVLRATTPLGLTPDRVVIRPDRFTCSDLWAGGGSQPICFGAFEQAGANMHAWVAFVGSSKVAAILLQRQVPPDGSAPPSPPPWQPMVLAFTVPPATFVMP